MSFKNTFAKELYASQEFYDLVLKRMGFDEDEENTLFKAQVQNILEKQLASHIATATLENAKELELRALFDFKNNKYDSSPLLSEEEIIMEFLLVYDSLRERVFATIPKFVDDTVEAFNS